MKSSGGGGGGGPPTKEEETNSNGGGGGGNVGKVLKNSPHGKSNFYTGMKFISGNLPTPTNLQPTMSWNAVAGWRPISYGATAYGYYGVVPSGVTRPPPPVNTPSFTLDNGPLPPWKLPPRPTTTTPNTTTTNAGAGAGGIKFNLMSNRTPIPVTPAASAMATAPSRPTPLPPPSTNGQWPPALRAYVDRCFSLCQNDKDRDKTEGALKARIQVAIKAGNLYSHDWASEPPLGVVAPPDPASLRKEQRARRFQVEHLAEATKIQSDNEAKRVRKSALLALAEDGIDWDEYTIIGTSQNLEKPYLRLTSAPDPVTVRPLPILKKTLEWLKQRWKEGSEYNFVCDQFKSLRQDLTVQRIRNEFTVQVYEIHARIALEKGDLGEYNQCQTQLKTLYEAGLTGHSEEFLAYRILYLLHTRNRQEMNSLLAQISPIQRANPTVRHALSTRSALALCNYHSFFKLYQAAPNMGGYLMDCYVKRERLTALVTICRAYRPAVELTYLTNVLAFDNPTACVQFLREAGATLLEQDTLLDAKASLSIFVNQSH